MRRLKLKPGKNGEGKNLFVEIEMKEEKRYEGINIGGG